VTPLPIDPVLPEVVATLARPDGPPAVVLHAPTGAGKTTRVPPALLDAVDGLILVVEPRRVAARAAAARMAAERGESVGQTVGYQVRLERKRSAATRILVVTTGILLRRMVSDPFLEGVGAIVLDEVHERSLDADLALSIARHLQREVRDDLVLVAMSATADTERLARFLDAPLVRSEGRTYPVDIRYLQTRTDDTTEALAARGARGLLDETGGDVLVFLPGVREIGRTAERLGDLPGVDVLPLHGRLPAAEQDRALRPGDRPRIVLATNVAETSVTLPSVRAVVDAGLVRQLTFDARRGLDRLVTVPNSRASADQRAGRAGRVGPGLCLRLWTEHAHHARPAHDEPELRRVSLEAALLTLFALGEPDVRAFPWLEPPPEPAIARALDLLTDLGALDDGLTPLGEALSSIPAPPRLARMVLAGQTHGCLRGAATAAALLSDRLPFRRDRPRHRSSSDLADLLDAMARDGANGWRASSRHGVRTVRRLADQLQRAAKGPRGEDAPLARALVAGFPDRVALRRPDGRYLLANGRGAVLSPDSAVRDAACVVALDVRDKAGSEATIHLASEADVDWLPARTGVEVTYDADRDRVVGSEVHRYRALVLSRREGVAVPAEQTLAALAEAAAAYPHRIVPDDRDTARLLARLRYLGRRRPDLDLPGATPDDLVARVWQVGRGCRSLAAVRKADWKGAMLGGLSWPQRQALDRLAPESITVPSGSAIRLQWPDEGPPVLAVRMQELFGLAETPTVAGAPVMLHLLAPNMRPQQITDDLAGFWARTWPQVRKELRARYPKHAWPEDPLKASAERRPRRKR
jgi:ATP-dependent helicase HrpB